MAHVCTTLKEKDFELAEVEHNPNGWVQELTWIETLNKSKGWRSSFIKTAFAETVYSC